jgi:hypothetical protein
MMIFESIGVLIVGLGLVMWKTKSLPKAFKSSRNAAAAIPFEAAKLLTEADIALLPPPVRRYVALTGSIGRAMVTEITMRFNATMYDAPGARGMAGPVEQYERFDLPCRLFKMTTWMNGLPVAVLHDFNRDQATMKVRLVGLFNVVDIGGPELTRAETVTILNDLAFFAPSRLIDKRLGWTEIDDSHARVTFTLGPNTVSAELVFNSVGELVDFISDDRGMLEKDGSMKNLRWTTPVSNYADIGGWHLGCNGDAIWHRPDGPFTYGHFRLTHYEAR